MSSINKILQKIIICSMMIILASSTVKGQVAPPIWWFGASGAANFNFYTGTTQRLNNSLTVPTPFHKGFGVGPYGSLLVEYRPSPIWGGMLNVGYDGLGAKYDGVEAPCDCPATLKTTLGYVSIEPSLRLGFKTSSLYFFAGPSLAINVNKDFAYTQLKQPNTNAEFSAVNNTILSGQIGAGFDIPLSAASSLTKVSLSPFISYHPYFGQDPRSIESLSVTTIRVGVALKFGRGHKIPIKETPAPVAVAAVPVAHDVSFTVRGPLNAPATQVSETLPMLNAVFFDEGSTEIPNRYVLLTKDQASAFKEEQLQHELPATKTVRSAGQLNVYHNILNILGDRMRENPGASISLAGSSAKGPQDGKELAESIKQYLVTVFGIDGSRIATRGSLKAHPSSEQPGDTNDLALRRAEDRRVDIESVSPELLLEVGGKMIKSVQMAATGADPLDNDVVLNVDSASQLVKSWSVSTTDDKGTSQHFGPFTGDRQGIPPAAILGNSQEGDYKITMQAEMNNGTTVTKESSVHLIQPMAAASKGSRYSIVFGFDKATTVAEYKTFLTNVVAPLIVDGAVVAIHGHTDNIGSAAHNQKLSKDRAKQTQKILEQAIANSGRDNVKFETSGFGSDEAHSPFDNTLPEERFYNRSVVIDIEPVK